MSVVRSKTEGQGHGKYPPAPRMVPRSWSPLIISPQLPSLSGPLDTCLTKSGCVCFFVNLTKIFWFWLESQGLDLPTKKEDRMPVNWFEFCRQDDEKLAQLVRARDCQSRGRRFISDQNPKGNPENSNIHRFELHRPSSQSTDILFQVIKALINQSSTHHSFLLTLLSRNLDLFVFFCEFTKNHLIFFLGGSIWRQKRRQNTDFWFESWVVLLNAFCWDGGILTTYTTTKVVN